MKLSRQQRILVKYLKEAGGSMTTYEIGRRFLNDHNAIWFDLRKRASELAKLGVLTSDKKTPARYTLNSYIEKKLILEDAFNCFYSEHNKSLL